MIGRTNKHFIYTVTFQNRMRSKIPPKLYVICILIRRYIVVTPISVLFEILPCLCPVLLDLVTIILVDPIFTKIHSNDQFE